jgi:hypothetical protein
MKKVLALLLITGALIGAEHVTTAQAEKRVWIEPATPPVIKVSEKVIKEVTQKETRNINILIAKDSDTPLNRTIKMLRGSIIEAQMVKDRDFDRKAFSSEIKEIISSISQFQ